MRIIPPEKNKRRREYKKTVIYEAYRSKNKNIDRMQEDTEEKYLKIIQKDVEYTMREKRFGTLALIMENEEKTKFHTTKTLKR